MSIKDFLEKIKLFIADKKDRFYSQEKGIKIKGDLYIVLIITLVGLASFGLGKISAYEKNKSPISILKTKEYMLSTVLGGTDGLPTKTNSQSTTMEIVASKSGTKYYYSWCSGASRIKEENKVWFNTIEDAKAVGLTPASNCTGLK